jgi:thioredoxin 1
MIPEYKNLIKFRGIMILSVNERTFPQEVLEASTPVLVNFWAPWCGLCRMIEPTLIQFQRDWKGQVKLLGLNADQSLRLANTYRLSTLPTLILFNQGEVLHRWEHFNGREELRRVLDHWMLTYHNESQPLLEVHKMMSRSS